MIQNPEHAFRAAEVISASAIVASIMGWVPPIAAVLALLWYAVLFYDRFFAARVRRWARQRRRMK